METNIENIKMERYPVYKESGVEWLGEVPEHWGISRLGVLLNPKSENNRIDLPLLSITREKGVILRDLDNEAENHNYVPDDLSNYKVLRKGQFGMNKMKAWQGSYGVSDYDGIVSPAYFIFVFDKKIDPKFFHISIRSKLYVSFFGSASDGVRIGQWDLSKERMKQIPFLIPPHTEQTRIAQFLDRKTAQIDQAIAQKERLIELLKARRQILIHNAVTRGLNPEVKMKDSGVEWIGMVPEHWEVTRMKFITYFINDGTHGSYPRVENGYRLLSVRNLVEDKFVFREDDSRVSERHFKEISAKFIVKNNDIQLAIVGATLGKVALVEAMEELFVTQRSICTIRMNKTHFVAKFILFYLKSRAFQSYLWNNTDFSAQPGVYLGTVKNAFVPFPPKSEQSAIVAYIESADQKITTAITCKQSEIEKLKEYKATLINSAVTGKIRV